MSIPGWEKLPIHLRTQLSKASISALSTFPADYPELELLPLAYTTATTSDNANYASMSVAVLATTSRGNVTINSTDTTTNPLVSPNWLLTESDQELAVQALKRTRQLANATNIAVGPEFAPGPTTQSDAAILDYIRNTMAPIHHACATCKYSKQSLRHRMGRLIRNQAQWASLRTLEQWSIRREGYSECMDCVLLMHRSFRLCRRAISRQRFVSYPS